MCTVLRSYTYCVSFPNHSYTYCVSFPNIPTRTVSHSQTFLHVLCLIPKPFLHVLCLIPKHSCMYTFSVYLHQLITWGGEGPILVHTYVYTDAESYVQTTGVHVGRVVCVSVCHPLQVVFQGEEGTKSYPLRNRSLRLPSTRRDWYSDLEESSPANQKRGTGKGGRELWGRGGTWQGEGCI